jgi:hypothetical protein
MDTRQHIDDWINERLGKDEEQLNLGAWTNMQSMLNGQNPYAKKDNKKWVIYLSALALLVGSISFSAIKYFNTSNGKLVNNKFTTSLNNETQSEISSTTLTDNNVALGSQEMQNSNTPATKVSIKSNETANILKEDQVPQIVYNKQNKSIAMGVTDEARNLNSSKINDAELVVTPTQKNIANKSFTAEYSTQNIQRTSTKSLANNKLSTNIAAAKSEAEIEAKSTPADVIVLKTANKITSNKGTKKLTAIHDGNENILEDQVKNEPPTKKVFKVKGKDYTAVTLAKKTVKVDGQKVDVVETLSVAKVIAPVVDSIVEIKENTFNSESVAKSVVKEIINPRAVNLSLAEQAKADRKPSLLPPAKAVVTNNSEPVFVASTQPLEMKSTAKSTETDTIKPIIKKMVTNETWLMSAMAATIASAQKLGEIKLFNYKLKVNPGIFTGLNMAAWDSQHNFGGFQAGTNVLLQLGKRIGLVQNLGFYMRNNGGYSIKDNQINISNKQVSATLPNGNIAYAYDMDSIAISHNFKNVYAFEFPLVIQYQLKSVGFYGGVNLAYGLKMKPQTFVKSFQSSVFDTLSSSFQYTYPNGSIPYYKTTDFNSRFGIGYVGGVNYQFNPQIYVDLRFAKSTWDNATTVSAQQMSANMFRLPTFSLSIGYRFNNNELSRR